MSFVSIVKKFDNKECNYKEREDEGRKEEAADRKKDKVGW